MATEAGNTFVLFTLAGATYGIHTEVVRQMEMIESITPVPISPPYVEGVAFSRGQIVPVINLRVRFGFERISHDLRSRLIVVAIEDRLIGLTVDASREFVTISPDLLRAPPDSMAGSAGHYIDAIAVIEERIIFILDVPKITTTIETRA